MLTVGLTHYLTVACTLFCLGLFCVLTRRNSIGILIGIELILNAANINLVAFGRFVGNEIAGQVWAIMVIILAASEAVVFLGLLMAVYQNFDTIEVDKIALLRDDVPEAESQE